VPTSTSDSRLTFPVCPHYIASAQTAYNAPLPRIPPLLSDVLSRPLLSNGLGIVNAGARFCCRGSVFIDSCLAMDAFSGFQP
jgi:hypothetical protein